MNLSLKKITIFSIISLISIFIGEKITFASKHCDKTQELGLEIIDLPKGIEIISSAMVTVPFDEQDQYLDALMEASMEAKANIASYFEEKISRECNIDSKTKTEEEILKLNTNLDSNIGTEFGKIDAEAKVVNILKTKYKLCSLNSNTSLFLRNVKKLSACYSKGNHVIVKFKGTFNDK